MVGRSVASGLGSRCTILRMTQISPARKANRAILALLVVSSALVATNLGEFWPFSIYPMFSQGGNNWSRTLVRGIEPGQAVEWQPSTLDDLPGDPVGVRSYGVDPIDLANFVAKTQEWTEARVDALHRMFFRDSPADRRLLVFRVNGVLTDGDEVVVEAVPYVLLDSGNTQINPVLAP